MVKSLITDKKELEIATFATEVWIWELSQRSLTKRDPLNGENK